MTTRTETPNERIRRERELDAWCSRNDICGPGADVYIASVRPDLLPPEERPEWWWKLQDTPSPAPAGGAR